MKGLTDWAMIAGGVMVGILILTGISIVISGGMVHERGGVELVVLAMQWPVRLLGITVALVAVVGVLRTVVEDPPNLSRRSALWTVLLLAGMELAQPNWALALGMAVIVVSLVVTGAMRPLDDRQE